MNGTSGLSAGDILALSKDNGGFFGGEGIWGIIMLLIIAGLFSGNGFGWGGNGANGLITEEYIANQFTQRDIFGNQTAMLEGNTALTKDILENRYNCSQNACTTQREILQNRYDNALQTQTLSAQMSNCCCDLKTAIHAEGEATRNMIQQDKIEQLREQVQTTNLALNNALLSNQIISTLQPTPRPSYIVASPYTSVYNPYSGCGCTNNLI